MNETNIVNGTIDSKIDESIPILSDVFLDGQPISKENISDIYDQDLPNYATFDKNNFTITGTFLILQPLTILLLLLKISMVIVSNYLIHLML